MWINNITKEQFDYIAKILRNNGRGYEWHTGDYTTIKVTLADIDKYIPGYKNLLADQ